MMALKFNRDDLANEDFSANTNVVCLWTCREWVHVLDPTPSDLDKTDMRETWVQLRSGQSSDVLRLPYWGDSRPSKSGPWVSFRAPGKRLIGRQNCPDANNCIKLLNPPGSRSLFSFDLLIDRHLCSVMIENPEEATNLDQSFYRYYGVCLLSKYSFYYYAHTVESYIFFVRQQNKCVYLSRYIFKLN